MTITVRGRAEVQHYLQQLPGKVTRIMRGGGRAGGAVIADEAKRLCRSDLVRENVTVEVRVGDESVHVRITVKKGFARSVGIWLEYGTDPHFITVDDSQRQGMTARRVNEQGKLGTLVINGKPVGSTVHHPGAPPHSFLRPALDTERGEAIAAALAYVRARLSGAAGAEPEVDSE